MKILSFLFISMILIHQSNFAQNNVVIIEPTDDSLTILRKAASVVPSARQLEWQKWEKTGFIHFGINTFTGKEWGDGTEDPSLFNPTNFDAEQWARIAKQSGIELLIITAKHHDGFCLWPTKTTEHSIKNSPFKRDIVQELALACNKYGVKFGFYLSPWDRNSKYYGTDQYNDFFVDQLTELVSNYGNIDEVWFDGANGEGPNGKKQEYDFKRYYEVIRKHQPKAVIAISGPDVRWVGTETGYGRETEWSVVPVPKSKVTKIESDQLQSLTIMPPGDLMEEDLGSRAKIMKAEALAWYPAETDVSIRPGWFYHEKEDSLVKSPLKLLDIYYNSIGKNGVLLLNIPPDKTGRIHPIDSASLVEWNQITRKIFSNNLVSKQSDWRNLNSKPLVDDDFNSSVSLGQDFPIEILVSTQSEIKTNLFSIQEDIRNGQRVERFSLWVKENNKWKKITEGTTVGYKRILSFDTIQGKNFKIVIEEGRGEIILSTLGLYLDEYSTKK